MQACSTSSSSSSSRFTQQSAAPCILLPPPAAAACRRRRRGPGLAPAAPPRVVVAAHAAAAGATTTTTTTTSGSSSGSSGGGGPPVLVVPAFYLDSQQFRPLVEELRARGFNAALPPIRWWNWVPTLGGRSVRPIIDRVDWALTRLLEGEAVDAATGYEVALPSPATWLDWLREFRDASQGAQPPLPVTGPWQPPPPAAAEGAAAGDGGGGADRRAALVASSAAGWISRIFLSRTGPAYNGRVWHGADRVHTLVTLGTPHVSVESVALRNITWVNTHHRAGEPGTRLVAVGARTTRGRALLPGGLGDFAFESYKICLGAERVIGGDVWGDGVTPLECALALEGAERVVLEGARHVPMEARPQQGVHWYGSGAFLDAWVAYLHPPRAAAAAAAARGDAQREGESVAAAAAAPNARSE